MSRHDDEIASDTSGDDFELFPVDSPYEPCLAGCGYWSDGPDLADHMFWEHQPCADCGATPAGNCSVTHRSDCPRLQPGYTYPPRPEVTRA